MHAESNQPPLSSSTRELLQRYVVPNYNRFEICLERGKGVQVWDDQGKRYVDFGTGIAVCSLGHSHPAVTSAVHAQVESLIHCSNLYYIREQAALAEHITEHVVQAPGKVFFCNSGAEANEALIKLARLYGHAMPKAGGAARHEIITFNGSFHGRTMAGISATGQAKVKEGFAPLLEGFRTVEYNNLDAVKDAISNETVAIMLEPVQGEGGIHVAHPDFLRGLARLCREHNLLLLFDEVQCGLGRLGHMCGWKAVVDDPEVQPDAIAWAKGLGGGFPIGGIWIRERSYSNDEPERQLCNLMGPGSHGSTFGGQPLACVTSLAVLEEIQRYKLWENAFEMGQYLVETIQSWNHPLVTQVRGLGLMLGIVLQESSFEAMATFAASGSTPAAFVVQQLMKRGLITVPAGRNVVRLLPPLNLERSEASEALRILKKTLDKLAKENVAQ